MKALSSISGRIAVGLVALFLSALVVGIAGWWTSNFAFQALQTVVSDRVVPLKDLKLISDKYAVDIVDASHKMRSGAFDWDKGQEAIRAAKTLIDDRWNAYMATYLTDEEKALAAKVEASRRESDTAIKDLIAIIASKDKAALDTFVTGRLYPAIDPTTAAIGELVDLQVRVAEDVFSNATKTFTIANAVVLTALALSVIAFGFACWVSFRKVLAPLGELTKAMTYLANGNTDRTIPHAERKDEIGAIAQAIGVFQGNAVERQRLEGAAQVERDRERRRQAHIESLIEGFRGTMAETLASVGSQTDTMRGTANKLTGVATSAANEANAAGTASSGASRNVQSVAAATEELAASIREIAGQAHQANVIVARATETATETDRNVSTLAEAAEKVGAIVDLIRDIAEQTNLLALNATIEAARAGDTGKGFAVVAAEVKSLATQTAKATDDIAAQITGIQSSTRGAVEAIRSINVTVGEISAATTTIAAAVEEQEAATREISKAIQSASDGTSQVASSVVSVNSAIDETSKEAHTVQQTSETLTTVSAALANAVEAFLTAVTSDLDERRAALRVRTTETVSVMVRGRRFNTRLIDLSDTGCRLREVEKLAVGEPVIIDLDDERVANGRVVRTTDGEVAISFDGAIKVRSQQAKAA